MRFKTGASGIQMYSLTAALTCQIIFKALLSEVSYQVLIF
jgi:hypothetical protein